MKKKLIIGVCITLVVILVAGTTIYRNSKPAVRTLKGVPVAKGTIGEEVFASGRLELSDKTEVDAPFAAKIKSVSVKLGDQVQAGQVLFELDTEDLQQQLDNAKLNLSNAKATLDQAKISRQYALEDAKKAVDDAAATLEKIKNGVMVLGPMGTAMQQADAQAAYDKAKQAYDRMVANPGSTGASITSLENNVKQAQASTNELQKQLASAVVKAPVAGTIVTLNAVAGSGSSGVSMPGSALQGLSAGTSEGAGGSLVTIANLDKLKARVKVNEIDSTRVKAGQKVKITCDAVGKDFPGNVESVAPTAVTGAGARGEETTVEVVVTLDNSNGLKPGYNINAAVKVSENTGSLLVPQEAVADRNGKKVVFVEENGVAKIHEVSLGISGETQLEITSGVKEGDKVILNPAANLNEGDKVNVDEQ